jgi:hypothetical protein
MSVKFERRYPKASSGRALRFWLLIVMAALCMGLLAYAIERQMRGPGHIEVHYLSATQFLVQGDTTQYEELASKVLKQLEGRAAQNVELHLYLPKQVPTAEVLPLVQLLQATQCPLRLHKRGD